MGKKNKKQKTKNTLVLYKLEYFYIVIRGKSDIIN